MPLFKQVNAIVLHVEDLEAAIDFYRTKLGHELKWKNEDRAGLVLGESSLVLSTALDPETNILVDSVELACKQLVSSGGKIVTPPEDIPVGKLAVIEDPFGNRLVLVDFTKGAYVTDSSGKILGVSNEA